MDVWCLNSCKKLNILAVYDMVFTTNFPAPYPCILATDNVNVPQQFASATKKYSNGAMHIMKAVVIANLKAR